MPKDLMGGFDHMPDPMIRRVADRKDVKPFGKDSMYYGMMPGEQTGPLDERMKRWNNLDTGEIRAGPPLNEIWGPDGGKGRYFERPAGNMTTGAFAMPEHDPTRLSSTPTMPLNDQALGRYYTPDDFRRPKGGPNESTLPRYNSVETPLFVPKEQTFLAGPQEQSMRAWQAGPSPEAADRIKTYLETIYRDHPMGPPPMPWQRVPRRVRPTS